MNLYNQDKYDDPAVWELFHRGETKGIFQLETNLGRQWSKKVQPNNINELAALVSILRPGCLKAKVDGKSMSQHYVDRKHGKEEIKYLHESLKDILEPTFGVLIYQEQCMRIAQKLAGFTEVEADVLRKAIGKKKADVMAEVRKDFIKGCESKGIVGAEDADEIFGWIEKSARYSFNKSHAVCYAVNAYWSAVEKVYHTEEFFVAWLQYAIEKQDPHEEIYLLVSAAKALDFKIAPPKITRFKEDFNNVGNTIYFGIKNIKSLTGKNGDKAIRAVQDTSKTLGKNIESFSWLEILLYYSPMVNSTCFKALSTVGFFRGIKDTISRNKALYEYGIFKVLTKTELAWVLDNYPKKRWKTLLDCFNDLAPTKKDGGGTFNESRRQAILNEIKMLNNPPYELEDDPEWIVDQESKLFGCPVSLSKVSNSEDINCNTTCKELLNGKKGKKLRVAGHITRVSNFKIKKEGANKGREMAFLTIEDETCSIDNVIVFPDCKEENKYSLFEGSNVVLSGNCEKDAFIVESVYEI